MLNSDYKRVKKVNESPSIYFLKRNKSNVKYETSLLKRICLDKSSNYT